MIAIIVANHNYCATTIIGVLKNSGKIMEILDKGKGAVVVTESNNFIR